MSEQLIQVFTQGGPVVAAFAVLLWFVIKSHQSLQTSLIETVRGLQSTIERNSVAMLEMRNAVTSLEEKIGRGA